MKRIQHGTRLYSAGVLIIALSGCGGGGGGGGNATNTSTPYPDPSNPSEFPIKADTKEGSSGDNTLGTAGTSTIGSTSYHTIYPVADEDWLKVDLIGGTPYEFSVDNVSYNSYPRLQLFDSIGGNITVPGPDQTRGYFSNNPRIFYTPSASGTYYLKVTDYAGGIASYTISSRIYDDSGDGDSFSAHYDCNVTDATIYPGAPETAIDTIDQSCSGYDWLDASATDAFEPDNDFGTAGSLPMFKGDPWDIINRGEVYAETHTIHSSDVDTFKITVPAYSAYEIMEVESTTGASLDTDLYLSSDLVTPISVTNSGFFINHWLDNSASDAPADFYLQVYATAGTEDLATYVIGLADGGYDVDGDGYFTRSLGSGWDCNDSNAAIHAGAPEASPSDGIDSNCNGKDED